MSARPYTFEEFLAKVREPDSQIMRLESRVRSTGEVTKGHFMNPAFFYPFKSPPLSRLLIIETAGGKSVLLDLSRDHWSFAFLQHDHLAIGEYGAPGGDRATYFVVGNPDLWDGDDIAIVPLDEEGTGE